MGTIFYTYVNYKTHLPLNVRIVRNETSIVINNLAEGKSYVFTFCLRNEVGKGPCEKKTITTLTTGNHYENCVIITMFKINDCSIAVVDCSSISIFTYNHCPIEVGGEAWPPSTLPMAYIIVNE